MSAVTVDGLRRDYTRRAETFRAVDGVALRVDAGEAVAVVGPSGCGKTTLLTMLAGLLTPTAGTVRVAGADLAAMTDAARCLFRNRHIGFVPQGPSLLANLTVFDNIRLPHDLGGVDLDPDIAGRVDYLLDTMDLTALKNRRPAELSGGEMRRVAVARALVNRPALLLADEPTGDLDPANIDRVMDALTAARGEGVAVVFSTHEDDAARRASRVLTMRDGRFIPENE